MTVTVYKNFLDTDVFENIKSLIINNNFFPWFYFPQSVANVASNNPEYHTPNVFRHTFVFNKNINSDLYQPVIAPILQKLSDELDSNFEVNAVYSNLLLPNNHLSNKKDLPHIDLDNPEENSLTGIFYITKSAGDTIVYNQTTDTNSQIEALIPNLTILKSIEPEPNKLVIWDSKHIHSAPSTSDSNRIVININIKLLK